MKEQLVEVYIYEPDILQIKFKAKILDVTAGNRMMWGKDKFRDDVIFCDKETNLKIKPDVICKWNELPFRDNSFECIIFDPPHIITPFGKNSKRMNPQDNYWYGYFNNRREAIKSIIKAQKEFARVAPRLCLKWNDADIPLDNVIHLFFNWQPVFIQKIRSKNHSTKNNTFWVKMVRKSGVS